MSHRVSGKVPPIILGAHMSIAGGYHKAVERARTAGCDCVQVFTKNNTQWRATPITEDDAERFRASLDAHQIARPLSHSSYLINVASPDASLWEQSIAALVVELQRAEQLGIPFVVLHPGSHTGSGDATGLARAAAALDEVHQRFTSGHARLLLENTAGQGSGLGWQFEHFAEIFSRVREPDRLGICFDTCHAFAAGYPLASTRGYRETIRKFERLVGLDRVRAMHLNDSARDRGSRVDRHAHIGRGFLGLDAFRQLLHDPRLRHCPMYLETPKGTTDAGEDWDVVNLRTLHDMAAS